MGLLRRGAGVPLRRASGEDRVVDDWIDYYDSTHTIYVSKRHRDLHFRIVADDIIGYISSPKSVVLDYSCGEALPGVRGRLIARFAGNLNIKVRSLDDLRHLDDGSVDLVVMISVAQYMTPDELDAAFDTVRRVLKPTGRFVLGDILKPEVGASTDVLALLRMGARNGFFKDACVGLARTALSDYWQLRTKIGLQRYGADEMIEKLAQAGFSASLAPANVGHNAARMTFVARHAF
jgi:SAM-dependent methyltransferase